ncbi:hypothetical protein ACWEKV_15650 [Janibacter hoylei]
MVHWERLGQPQFDRLINALVDRMHSNAGDEVEVIDGRGGDGGLDIRVVTADGRELIYQLKYFPEGFDGSFKDRRRQITRSLDRALQTCPELDEWILVAPCTATRSGFTFIKDLKAKHPGITITFVDRSRLDSTWTANYPDVVRAVVTRNEVLEHAAILNQEKALLAGGLPDLLDRHRSLDQVSRGAHPDWYWEVSIDGDRQTSELRAHHPRAAERSPFGITVTTTGAPDDPDLKRFTAAMSFGAIDTVRLPGHLVTEVIIDGPEIVKSGQMAGEIVELRFVPELPESQPLPFTLELDSADSPTTFHQGLITQVAHGPAGTTVRQTFQSEAVVLTWRLPNERPGQAAVDVMVNLGQAHGAYDLWSATRLLHSWASSQRVRMILGETPFAVLGRMEGALDSSLRDSAIILNEFTDDLLFIGREFGREFVVPESVSQLDRIDTRIFRRMLEGKMVCLPFSSRINVTFTPAALEAVDDWTEPSTLVALFPAEDPRDDRTVEPASSRWTLDALKSQGAVAELVLDEQMGYFFPEMALEDATAVKEKLAQGANVSAHFSSSGDQRPRIYLPSRVPPDKQVTLEPWGLYGVEEVPELRDASLGA